MRRQFKTYHAMTVIALALALILWYVFTTQVRSELAQTIPTTDITDNNYASQMCMVILIASSMVVLVSASGAITTGIVEVPSLMKSLNTLRVLGTTRGQICYRIMTQSILRAMTAFAIATVCIGLIGNWKHSGLVLKYNYSLATEPLWMITTMFGIALTIGIMAGLYPAYYAKSQRLSVVTRSRYSVSRRDRRLLDVMLCLQFAFCFSVMLYFSIIIWQNFDFMRAGYGFDNVGVVYVRSTFTAMIFAGCCILITLLNLLSVNIIERRYMQRSIAIRRVLGTTIGELILMQMKHYGVILIISSLLGMPSVWWFAYYKMDTFHNSYKMMIGVPLTVFSAMAIVVVISIVFQNIKNISRSLTLDIQA